MYRVMAERGAELRFGRLLYERLRSLGLDEVGANARLSMGSGGSAAASFQRFNCCRFRDAMIAGDHIGERRGESRMGRRLRVAGAPELSAPSGRVEAHFASFDFRSQFHYRKLRKTKRP